jgi:hypothetical protein
MWLKNLRNVSDRFKMLLDGNWGVHRLTAERCVLVFSPTAGNIQQSRRILAA